MEEQNSFFQDRVPLALARVQVHGRRQTLTLEDDKKIPCPGHAELVPSAGKGQIYKKKTWAGCAVLCLAIKCTNPGKRLMCYIGKGWHRGRDPQGGGEYLS